MVPSNVLTKLQKKKNNSPFIFWNIFTRHLPWKPDILHSESDCGAQNLQIRTSMVLISGIVLIYSKWSSFSSLVDLCYSMRCISMQKGSHLNCIFDDCICSISTRNLKDKGFTAKYNGFILLAWESTVNTPKFGSWIGAWNFYWIEGVRKSMEFKR